MGSQMIKQFKHKTGILVKAMVVLVLATGGCLFTNDLSPLTTQIAYAEPASDTSEASDDAQLTTSHADTSPVVDELQKRVEETATAYNDALAKLKEAEDKVTQNQAQIVSITNQLAEQREKSSAAAAEFYRMQRSSNTLLELLFSATSFSELTVRFDYITRMQDSYFYEIERLSNLNDQLTKTNKSLEEAKQAAESEAVRAEEALADAKSVRDQARIRAEAEALAQALAASMPVATPAVIPSNQTGSGNTASSGRDSAATSGSSSASGSGSSSGSGSASSSTATSSDSSESTASDSSESADSNSATTPDNATINLDDRETFIAYWAERIDAYLASSPLGGYGTSFAAAAWDYGVDPRVAPAISCIESSKGRYCFLQCNAWGWGSYSWPDWPTAIENYTAGFSRGYGYTVTLDGAKKYTPESWPHWYPKVIGEMNSI